jgi:hypothetical protein
MATLRTVLALGILTIFTGCSSGYDQKSPAFRAMRYKAGQTEAALISDVGPPTSERRVAAGHFFGCHAPAERALSYQMNWVGWEKVVGGWLHVSPNQFTVICVDANKRITETFDLVVN